MRVCDLSVALISYFVGTEHLYALLLNDSGELRRFKLARCAQVFPQIDELLEGLEHPLAWTYSHRSRLVRDFAERWGSGLLPPQDALSPYEVLLIVPHHFLHGVPLHLVKHAGKVLATTYGISYCSSATLLHHCAERNKARRFDARTWTFPMDGDGADASGPLVETCLSCGIDVLTDKNAAYHELAHAFANQFPEHGIAWTREDVKHALDPTHRGVGESRHVAPDVLCLVCHGHRDANYVERSGLLLTGRPGARSMRSVRVHRDTVLSFQDHPFYEIPLRLEPVRPSTGPPGPFEPEMLTTGELRVQCASDAQLVALLGCSTGTGVVRSNDEYVSLANQWLEAGATSVIANLWEADLSIISDWAKRFAVHWTRLRQPKVIAAREATRMLVANNPGLAEELALWGSMAVFGDWL